MPQLELEPGSKILPALRRAGIEPDQRILDALRIASPARSITDAHLLLALCRLNPRGFSHVPPSIFRLQIPTTWDVIPEGNPIPVEDVCVHDGFLARLLKKACATSRAQQTLGSTSFLEAILDDAVEHGESYPRRGHAVDLLIKLFTGTSVAALSSVPEAQALFKSLRASVDGTDDYQYTLVVGQGRIAFRIVSTLGDYFQEGDSGLLVPGRALLNHLGGIGFFERADIEELEELINSRKASEQDFQAFFERHPHFLRRHDYREVHPHVFLAREEHGMLVPDFILTNKDAQDAAIVELKRATLKRKIVRRQDNRTRFADAVMEARAQLLEYRDWFDAPENRRMLKETVGMEVYRPRLMAIIGRATEFGDEFERQQLRARHPDIEVVTYDDILRDAKERMITLDSTGGPRAL